MSDLRDRIIAILVQGGPPADVADEILKVHPDTWSAPEAVEGTEPAVAPGRPFKRTLAIDFDGVIHLMGRGHQDGALYDRPVPGAFGALRRLRSLGYRVIIFTSRDKTWHERMRQWFVQHLGSDLADLPITNVKPIASVYVDDRALRFTTWADTVKVLD